ncbi:large polymerase protein [avian paramyxovirus 20]|uniref:RNA-directed RNA polymerase L n=1 Tax=avian paramyxovirus 20 TaxID=2560314 RepID=A0A2I6ECH9_9MONO|nr:large polymerase protein [Avian metaavulavirus 20]AUJ87608.1 large polymerase protein [Avian metaavulavirus 20]
MDQTQADSIIQPEVHLNSPLVRNKLLLLWKLSGLPQPHEFTNLTLSNHATLGEIQSNESKIRYNLEQMTKRVSDILRQRGDSSQEYQPILHPRVLKHLSQITCAAALSFCKDKNRILHSVFGSARSGYTHLFSAISHQLIGNGNLFVDTQECPIIKNNVTSEGCNQLLNSITTAMTTQWSDTRWSWLHIKQVMRYLIKQARVSRQHSEIRVWSENWGLIGVTPDIVAIFSYKDRWMTVLTFEMVLMYSDMMEGRDNVTLVACLSPALQPLVSRLDILFTLVDTLAYQIGDKVYDFVAVLESMAYASVQLHDASKACAGEFFSFNLAELHETLSGVIDPKEVKRIVAIIRTVYSGLSVDQGAELLCIMRLFGHPLLTAQQAAKKVRESMCAPKLVEIDSILQVLSFFKGIIINGFRRSHSGLWPNVVHESIIDDDLRQLYHESAEIPHSFMLRKYKALSMLEFQKSIEFDLNDDLSTFLKDKAICRPKSQWTAIFRKSLLPNKMQLLQNQDVRSNRLLIDFLESADFDPEMEFNYVRHMDYLQDDQFCASYSLKEKEIKTTGRIFAKMTRKMRSCQVILESLLSKHICKFFKENGVSMEQLSLTKSLLAMSQLAVRVCPLHDHIATPYSSSKSESSITKETIKPGLKIQEKFSSQRKKAVVATFLTTDLQKYCLNWRYSTIKLFALALNQIFGIEHGFEWIHLRLMNSTLFVGDPFSPPEDSVMIDLDDMKNDDIFIVSPRGGIEGLCQKLWTMISISIIHCVAQKIGARVAAMVQGDNQVIAITREIFPGDKLDNLESELDKLGDLFFSEFKLQNYALGHNLKPKETIQSQSFFVYSKRIFWEGRILSQILKNAAKVCLVSDNLGENTVASCSNISSTITRMIENGLEKDTALVLNHAFVITQLLFDEHYSIVCNYGTVKSLIGSQNWKNLHYATLVPGQVGGYGFLNLSRLFTRNIGDPVTCALSDLKWYIKSQLLPEFVLKNVILREPGEGSWSTLCADPYSLNIPYIQLPTTYLKRHTQKSLLSNSSNPLLAGVQVQTQYQEEEALSQFLLDRDYVMPRVAHVVMETSILGKRKQIQGLIDTTPTIIKTALMTNPVSRKKCDKIIEYSLCYLTSCHDEVLTNHSHSNHATSIWDNALLSVETCSLVLSDYLRTMSWSNILNGRPITGVTSPDTLELISGSLIGENSTCRLCELGDDNMTWMHLKGPIYLPEPSRTRSTVRVPYLGSKTEERKTASMANIKGMSHHLKAALRGTSVMIWAFGDSDDTWNQALILANTRCNLDITQLRLLTPIPSSSNIQHRLSDGISVQKFTPASLSRVSSFVQICNDNQKLERDGGNVDSNLIYQQIMLLGLSIMETLHPLHHTWILNDQTIHLHTGQSCCIREIDTSFANSARWQFPDITVTMENPFLYDPTPVSTLDEPILIKKEFFYNELNIDAINYYDAIVLLSKCVAKLMSDCILEEGVTSSVKNDALVSFDNSINWISEILYCDIHIFVQCLGQDILLTLAYQMYYLRITGRNNMLYYLRALLDRIPTVQLANMALTISHPEVFRRLLVAGVVKSVQGPYIATIDFIAICRDIIVSGAEEYLASLLAGVELSTVFFNSQDGELTPKMEQFLARRLCLLTLLTGSQIQMPVIRHLSAIEKCTVLTDFLSYLVKSDHKSYHTSSVLYPLSLNPKIDSLISNLYFTTRRTLSNLRSNEQAKAQIAFMYTEESNLQTFTPEECESLKSDYVFSRGLFFTIIVTSDLTGLHKFESIAYMEESPICSWDNKLNNHQPPIVHLLKTVGSSSTSWYKFSVIAACQEKSHVLSGDSLYIGEGSGSVMTLFEFLDPGHKIYYNSLFFNEWNPPQRNFGPTPGQFLNSIVYKNILAGVPCKYGYVQEFCPMWRDIDQESNVTDTSFLNFGLELIPAHTVKRVVCDIEFDFGMPIERMIQGYTHILILSAMVLKRHGVFLLKVYRKSEKLFQFVLSCCIMLFGECKIHQNLYMSMQGGEVVIECKTREDINFMQCPNVISRVNAIISRSLTIVHPDALTRLRTEQDTLLEKIAHFSSSVFKNRTTLHLSQLDSLLLQLGGQLPMVNGLDPRVLSSLDIHSVRTQMIDLIDTAITECNVIYTESDAVDLALMLGPFNLNRLRKISTIAQACIKHCIPLWIAYELTSNHQSLTYITTQIGRGIFRFIDLMTPREFVSLSKRPRFIKKVYTLNRLNSFFEIHSKIILSRAEIKQLMKFSGALLKFKLE